MKKKSRTIEIRVEREEIYLVRRSRKAVEVWCDGCGALVWLCTADEAATRAGVTTRTIYRWVEQGKIHFAETPTGRLLVCSNSIPR